MLFFNAVPHSSNNTNTNTNTTNINNARPDEINYGVLFFMEEAENDGGGKGGDDGNGDDGGGDASGGGGGASSSGGNGKVQAAADIPRLQSWQLATSQLCRWAAAAAETLKPQAMHAEIRCKDGNARCKHWASEGECDANPAYMKYTCRAACGVCSTAQARDHTDL